MLLSSVQRVNWVFIICFKIVKVEKGYHSTMTCLMFKTALWPMSAHILIWGENPPKKNTISCAYTNTASLEHKSLLKMMGGKGTNSR